jgi:hypothetical protein
MQTKSIIPCPVCGKDFEDITSRARRRVTCGRACMGKYLGLRRLEAGAPTFLYLMTYCTEHINDADDNCWPWPFKAKQVGGYGLVTFRGDQTVAHRVSYELFVKPFADGMLGLHRCDNPPCFRPSHIFEGDHRDNILDSIAKGRYNRPNGERVNTAVLTADDVKYIRETYRPRNGRGHEGNGGELARQFGISISHVSYIMRRKSWKHVL